jgi:hypothetical protein
MGVVGLLRNGAVDGLLEVGHQLPGADELKASSGAIRRPIEKIVVKLATHGAGCDIATSDLRSPPSWSKGDMISPVCAE